MMYQLGIEEMPKSPKHPRSEYIVFDLFPAGEYQCKNAVTKWVGQVISTASWISTGACGVGVPQLNRGVWNQARTERSLLTSPFVLGTRFKAH